MLIILLKSLLFFFLVFWVFVGVWLVMRYHTLFGPHKDDPAESAGARSFGVAHIWSIWIGTFALGAYFLFK